MPRAKQVKPTAAATQQVQDIWNTYGYQPPATLPDFDIDTALLWEVVSSALLDGQMVNLKAGDGGQSLGVQIWNWDNKRPYMWFGEGAEFDQWATEMIARAKTDREAKHTP